MAGRSGSTTPLLYARKVSSTVHVLLSPAATFGAYRKEIKMSVVTIPFVFETCRNRRGLVPICISETDADGHRIAWPWLEAVVPVADYLRKWLASGSGMSGECRSLADVSVQAQWRTHRNAFGRYCQRRIAAYARWAAEDLR